MWTHALADALEGRQPTAFEKDKLITGKSLQRYLAVRVPEMMRVLFGDTKVQTPQVVYAGGAGDVLICDLVDVLHAREASSRSAEVADGLGLERCTFIRDHARYSVKRMAGFAKYHSVPNKLGSDELDFVRDVGAEDLKKVSLELQDHVRISLELNRTDVDMEETSTGWLLRSKCASVVTALVQASDPAEAILRVAVSAGSFSKLETVEALFGAFDAVDVERNGDVAAAIDAAEIAKRKRKDLKVNYSGREPDEFELALEGHRVRAHVRSTRARFILPGGFRLSATQLLEETQVLLRDLGDLAQLFAASK